MIASDFGTGQVFLSMLWFTLFFIWVWLLIVVFADIFKSPDLSGGGKAIWTIFVIVLPYLGVFCYLIARGHKMNEHAQEEAEQQERILRAYVKDVVNNPDGVDQLTTLNTMHDRGVISDDEFSRMKARVTA